MKIKPTHCYDFKALTGNYTVGITCTDTPNILTVEVDVWCSNTQKTTRLIHKFDLKVGQ